MNKKSVGSKDAADKLVKNIRRKTSRKYSAEEKIRIVLAGLRGEETIPQLVSISASLFAVNSAQFLVVHEYILTFQHHQNAAIPKPPPFFCYAFDRIALLHIIDPFRLVAHR